MTIEVLMVSFAGGLFLIVCGLVVFIFTAQQGKVSDVIKSVNALREMLDAKLTQLGHALATIDKDLRDTISDTDRDLRSEIFVLDRRTTRLEAETHQRRAEDNS